MQTKVLTDPVLHEVMRTDLQQSLTRSHVDPGRLSIFQRILLTTNGTLTEILEAYLFEQIQMVKLSESLIAAPKDIKALDLIQGNQVIDRRILLRGKISRKNFVYAESLLVPDRLDPQFKQELLTSKTPLGRLWLEYKLETFKEIIDSAKEPARGLGVHFQIAPEDQLLSRTYRVFSKGIPIMTITEKFPESYFLQDF